MSRYTGVSQLQLRVSRYTVQLSMSVSLWDLVIFLADESQAVLHGVLLTGWRCLRDVEKLPTLPEALYENLGLRLRPLDQLQINFCHFSPSFPCFFGKSKDNTTKKNKDSYPCRTPKILGKEGKNAPKSKEFLEKTKMQGNSKKGKEKKIRGRSRHL